jgi:flagellar protein FlaG
VDEDTDRLVVKLTDRETGELIRQFPSEETLAISRSIGEFQQGFLLKQKA